MKNILTIILVIGLTFSVFAQNKKVAILQTVDREKKVSYAHELMVRSNLAKAITNKSGYEAYDRADIDNLMKEHNFQATGLVSDEQIKELGVMTGAQFVLIAEAALVDAKHIYVTAKILNVETAQVDITDNELMTADPQSIQKGCQKLANRLLGISGKANTTSHSSIAIKILTQANPLKPSE